MTTRGDQRSLWLLWAALTALAFAAMFVTAQRYSALEPYRSVDDRSVDDWRLALRSGFYAPLGWLAVLAPVAAAAALIFRRWPPIFLGVLAFAAVAQCAILGIEAWAHARPPKPLIERWLG